MSDTSPDRPAATLADYERFVAARPEEERWELIAGVVTAMTNPTETHEQLVANLFAPLKMAMDRAGCRTYAGGMRVQRSEKRDETMATLPDVLVRCGPRGDRTFVTDPVVVVEVLSRSTMHRDRGAKFDFYRSLPTLQHVALVYQGQMQVEHYRRTPEGWTLDVLSRPSDRLAFDAVGFTVDLEAVYFDVPALRLVEAPGADDSEAPTLIE